MVLGCLHAMEIRYLKLGLLAIGSVLSLASTGASAQEKQPRKSSTSCHLALSGLKARPSSASRSERRAIREFLFGKKGVQEVSQILVRAGIDASDDFFVRPMILGGQMFLAVSKNIDVVSKPKFETDSVPTPKSEAEYFLLNSFGTKVATIKVPLQFTFDAQEIITQARFVRDGQDQILLFVTQAAKAGDKNFQRLPRSEHPDFYRVQAVKLTATSRGELKPSQLNIQIDAALRAYFDTNPYPPIRPIKGRHAPEPIPQLGEKAAIDWLTAAFEKLSVAGPLFLDSKTRRVYMALDAERDLWVEANVDLKKNTIVLSAPQMIPGFKNNSEPAGYFSWSSMLSTNPPLIWRTKTGLIHAQIEEGTKSFTLQGSLISDDGSVKQFSQYYPLQVGEDVIPIVIEDNPYLVFTYISESKSGRNISNLLWDMGLQVVPILPQASIGSASHEGVLESTKLHFQHSRFKGRGAQVSWIRVIHKGQKAFVAVFLNTNGLGSVETNQGSLLVFSLPTLKLIEEFKVTQGDRFQEIDNVWPVILGLRSRILGDSQ